VSDNADLFTVAFVRAVRAVLAVLAKYKIISINLYFDICRINLAILYSLIVGRDKGKRSNMRLIQTYYL